MALIQSSEILKNYYLLRLNQPEKRNALSPDLVKLFKDHLKKLAKSNSVKVLGITGSGNSFCSGADLGMLKKMQKNTDKDNLDDTEALAELYDLLWNFPVPTIGLVNGSTMAGGLGLLSTLDYAIAVNDTGAKFGFSEVRIGFVPAIVSNYLIRKIPGYLAKWLLLSGDIFDVNKAKEMNLIQEIVEADQLESRAKEIANDLIEKNSREAMIATKKLINRISDLDISQGVNVAIEANVAARKTESCKEGISAFLEKRKPDWPNIEK